MQNAAFRAAGLGDWVYELDDVPRHALPAAVARLRGEEYAGGNVTIPHKRDVIELLDEVAPDASEVGAVNTIVRRGATLAGHNTDVHAIREALASAGARVEGARAVVLGAGGSAHAARVALAGASTVYVARDPERCALGPAVAWDDPAWHDLIREAAIVVNATPLGREHELPLPPALLAPAAVLLDLVYVPGGTPLVRAARAAGVRVVDGWTLLLLQGAEAFRLWTGRQAPVEAMRAALEMAPA